MSAVATSAVARRHLAWSLVDGVGPVLFRRLREYFADDLERAWQAPAGELRQLKGVGAETAEKLARGRDEVDVDAELTRAEELGVRLICEADDDFPAGLRRMPDRPLVLYVKGTLEPTDAVAVAIVGSRRCSLYGSEQARRFGELLAGAGFTVVSGLARGIDAFAHHGALDAGGRTLAVLGCGLATVYPPENKPLAERVVTSGALISELPLTSPVRSENFPSRNRIIAGLSLGVVVVEAAKRSGALITARLATEYHREVFAVPGRVQDPAALGSNALIRDGGAKLVMDLEDVLGELGELASALRGESAGGGAGSRARQGGLFEGGAGEEAPGPLPKLTLVEQRVYELVPTEAVLQDQVFAEASFPVGDVLAAFTSLELKGLVRRLPGNLIGRRGRS